MPRKNVGRLMVIAEYIYGLKDKGYVIIPRQYSE